MSDFEHRVEVSGGYNLIRPESKRNYGIGACKLTFLCIGEKGAVQWVIGSEWFPENARNHLSRFPQRPQTYVPTGWDLGYHAKEPHYEGQSAMECRLFPEGKCFYDGSGLNADLLIEGFLHGGTGWLWPQLESYYRCVFENAPFPDFVPVPRKHPDDGAAA